MLKGQDARKDGNNSSRPGPSKMHMVPPLSRVAVFGGGPCGHLGHRERVFACKLMSPRESELLVTVVRLDWFPLSGLLKTFPSLPSVFCDESNQHGAPTRARQKPSPCAQAFNLQSCKLNEPVKIISKFQGCLHSNRKPAQTGP